MNKTFLSGSGILISAVIFILVNGIADKGLNRFYADLTEEGLYTLSEGSREILSNLEQPITLKLYYSKTEGDKFPIIKLYGTRVADLVKEYARKSDGKLDVEIYDPRPDSEDEEWAEKYGVTPMDLPSGERVFLGLVAVNSLGVEDVIPVFNIGRQEFLEYDITKLIYSLDTGAQPVVGLISPLAIKSSSSPEMPMGFPPSQGREKPWIFASQLSKLAEVKQLPLEVKKIPAEITTLFVVHPRGLSQETKYAIDQYLMNGGNLFVAVDPFCMTDSPPSDPSNPMANFTVDRSSEINDMSTAWGVTLQLGKVVGDVRLATPVATQRGQENFIAWLSLQNVRGQGDAVISPEDVITNGLSSVMLPWSGALEFRDVEGVERQVLLQTSSDAMLFEEKDIRFMAEDPQGLMNKYRPGSKVLPLGVKLTGKFSSAFPSAPGSAKEEALSSTPGGHIPSSLKPATIVFVADVDFMADSYSAVSQKLFGTEIVSLLNDNINLVNNVAENLSGSNELIGLRSRGRFTRPFTKVQEIEIDAQQKYQEQENIFQQALNQANQRLSELQSGIQGEGKTAVLDEALLKEIEIIREEKRVAQQNLRQVRRDLREDKERLGVNLFLLNTFLVPVLLLIGAFLLSLRRRSL